MDESKPFYLSKTLYVNVLVMLLGLVATATGTVDSTDAAAESVAIIGFMNIILRFATKGRVTIS